MQLLLLTSFLPLPLVFHGSWRWISTHRHPISIIEKYNPTKNNILDAMVLFNLWYIISTMVKGMLNGIVVVVVVSHLLPSSLHQKCPMYLHMQLQYRPIQIIVSNSVLVPNGTPCKPQLIFLERCFAPFGCGSNNKNSTMSIAVFWRLFWTMQPPNQKVHHW